MMNEAWIWALAGGALIGVASSLLLLMNGRIAGISGILNELFFGPGEGRDWRLLFVVGLLIGGLLLRVFFSPFLEGFLFRSPFVIAFAGLLVGFGTAMGKGCTSGHGVCGISRLSVRSLIATLVFIAAGVLTVTLISLLGVL